LKKLFESYKSDLKATYHLSLPIIAGQLGIMIMGLVDTIQVGRMDKGAVEALAAAADANGILINISIIGYICLQIVSPMVAKAKAEMDLAKCNLLLRANLWVALLMAIICSVLVVAFGLNMEILQQPSQIRELTQEYLWIMTASTIPAFLFSAIKSFTDGLSHTKVAMNITWTALLMNIVLNYFFIYGIGFFPALGLNGAGIATFISRIYMVIAIAYYTFSSGKFQEYLKAKVDTSEIVSIVKTILKIGVPSGFQGFFEIAAFYGAVVMMGWISIQHKAAHQVAIGFVSLTYMAATGIATAGGIRVGSAVGAKNREAIFRAGSTALFMGVMFMSICGILMLSFNDFFASYVKDEGVILLAAQLIIWGGVFQLFDGVQAVSLGILRGVQDVNIPTMITIFAYWGVGLPLCYILGFTYDLKHIGIWIGLTISLFASASLLSWRFYNKVTKMKL
jgi:multidrug resistance protein, MATE family